MGKLVRDKIPAIIEADGKTPEYSVIVDDDIYEMELYIKLQEEMQEFLDAHLLGEVFEELADMLEVIYAIAKVYGVTPEQLETLRWKKAEERGSFDKRIFLRYVK